METSKPITGIIVADDDVMIRSVLRSKLESINQEVFLASNGVETLELASRMQASLILLDLDMPLLNGLLTCQRIRQMPGYDQTPIVILTAYQGKDAEAAVMRVGATAFLTKPFRLGEVLKVLSRLLPVDEITRQELYDSGTNASAIAHAAQPRGLATAARGTLSQMVNSTKVK